MNDSNLSWTIPELVITKDHSVLDAGTLLAHAANTGIKRAVNKMATDLLNIRLTCHIGCAKRINESKLSFSGYAQPFLCFVYASLPHTDSNSEYVNN